MSIKFQLIRVWFTFISGVSRCHILRAMACCRNPMRQIMASPKLIKGRTAISNTRLKVPPYESMSSTYLWLCVSQEYATALQKSNVGIVSTKPLTIARLGLRRNNKFSMGEENFMKAIIINSDPEVKTFLYPSIEKLYQYLLNLYFVLKRIVVIYYYERKFMLMQDFAGFYCGNISGMQPSPPCFCFNFTVYHFPE
jgi:hypothetical protein